uniref:Divalent-cation tolerance protein CutA n=1 Tax=Panagrolaimus sp. ES5 TaxID=591445 RepID=A0AC34FQQ6_9BILA
MATTVGPSLIRMTSAIFSVVYVTVPNAEIANKIARSAVEAKLAACVNIVPGIKSIYEWQGKIEEENELLLILKTKTSELDRLKEHVLKNHPYDVPEFISLPIESGSEPYLKWINEQVQGKEILVKNP